MSLKYGGNNDLEILNLTSFFFAYVLDNFPLNAIPKLGTASLKNKTIIKLASLRSQVRIFKVCTS